MWIRRCNWSGKVERNLAAGCAHPPQLRTTAQTKLLRGATSVGLIRCQEVLAPGGGEVRTGLSFHCYPILLCLLVEKVCTACMYFRTRMK